MSITRNLLITALMMSAGHVVAASSVDLSVKGTITPSACEVSVSNGGQFDLGKIAAKDLSPDGATYLPVLNAEVTTTCEGATLIALEPKDNRAGSAHINDDYLFGLGLINGTEKLGAMTAALRSHIADGVVAYSINSSDGGLTWTTGGFFKPTSNLVSVRQGATTAPVPVQLLVSTLRIEAEIAPTNSLTLTNEVPIDGSITLTVRYL
ncbi:DUF1120 domain-containing protein [Pseudomonas sp. B6002]|uniref:DUF1120 domain-containing protein n=1 Tax=Pseudomonas sp. B6002 TaxID=2726978 RepID=UPI0015A461BC|nr:DUF1120 domain-containing protein [Pseudomonas sp. B6002]NVZ49605.1 DUF1120 domain-containing protein [Pseudomonas sp. B6002]